MERLLARRNESALMESISYKTLQAQLKSKRWLDFIERDYSEHVSPIKRPRWEECESGIVLEDAYTGRPCILFPSRAKAICVWPSGDSSEYIPNFDSALDVPDLPRDVLGLIFKRLSGETLLRCRRVSKKWNKVASSDIVWQDKLHIPVELAQQSQSWSRLPKFQQFVQYTFNGANYGQLIRHLVRCPSFMAFIFRCESLSTSGTHRLIPEPFRVATYHRKRRYWIPVDKDVIKSDNVAFQLQDWLSKYRIMIKGSKR